MIQKLQQERYAARDAPSENEFEMLYQATFESDSFSRQIEDRFLLLATGRLGMRSGEVLHFLHDDPRKWIDREEQMIQIPAHAPCDCRYCREQAESAAKKEADRTTEDLLELYWQPKFSGSVRSIPYGWSPRTIEVVESFVDEIGGFSVCQSTLNRRIDTLHNRAGLGGNTYPHALRAAAALWWANQGVYSHHLQAFFGWEDMRVASSYIRASGKCLKEHVLSTLGKEPEMSTVDVPELPEIDSSRTNNQSGRDHQSLTLTECAERLR